MTPAEKLAKKHKRQRAPRNRSTVRNTPWKCCCRELRDSLGLTLDHAAVGCGLSKTAYWQIEQGTDPMLTTAIRIAKFYGREIGELWK
jgi:DNA-binding XRE family transcriptional regulator